MFWIYIAALVGLLVGMNTRKLAMGGVVVVSALVVADLAGWSASELWSQITQQI